MAQISVLTAYTTSPTTTPATAKVDTVTGIVDPEFQVSKKYPTIGYITSPANLTIDVVPPPTFYETFTAFSVTYGTPLAIVAAGIVGAFMTFFIDHLRRRKERKR